MLDRITNLIVVFTVVLATVVFATNISESRSITAEHTIIFFFMLLLLIVPVSLNYVRHGRFRLWNQDT